MTSLAEKQDYGLAGATYEAGTTARSAGYSEIHTVTATVFAAIDWVGLDGDTFTGVTLPADFKIKGQIKSFTLTSGSVIAYKSVSV